MCHRVDRVRSKPHEAKSQSCRTRVQFLADLDLVVIDSELDITCLQTTAVHLEMNSINIIITARPALVWRFMIYLLTGFRIAQL